MRSETIVGIKITHDGAVAVLHGNSLSSVLENEKVDNNLRHAPLNDIRQIHDQLEAIDVRPDKVEGWAIDGWFTQGSREADPDDLEFHENPVLRVRLPEAGVASIPVAPYREYGDIDALAGISAQVEIPGLCASYRSHFHTTGHLASGYCTSPWARDGRIALVIVWDGGVAPRAYVVAPSRRRVSALGQILPLKGNVYAKVAAGFPPFRPAPDADPETLGRLELEIPGKVMAYAASGKIDVSLSDDIRTLISELSRREHFGHLPAKLAAAVVAAAEKRSVPSADALCTWQALIGDLLEDAVANCIIANNLQDVPVILTGGCMLNIGWNSRLRDSDRIGAVWVPPFPNDAGSAIGAACAELMRRQDDWYVDWDVYSGPELVGGQVPPGWERRAADSNAIARLLHDGAVVMILDGQAELGPRALGHRSIVAAPVTARARDELNAIKDRESYRPVAPVCLEERAAEIFDPGGRDPYMLFQHRVREHWRARVPAIVHVDGTARLQTVSRDQDASLYDLLSAYSELSGIPVLCNTSANLRGSGFFPSLTSALEWGRVDHVWSDGFVYSRLGANL